MRRPAWPLMLLPVVAIPAWATPGETVTLGRPLAMGGAYRAAGAANGAIYINPAGMSRLSLYTLEWAWSRGDLGGDEDTFHVSIVDTKTQPVGVGVGYSFVPADTDRHDGRLALSYPLLPATLFGGATARYLLLDAPGEDNASAFAVDAGLAAVLGAGFHAGLSMGNAMPDDGTAETKARQFGGGLAYEGSQLTAAFDAVYDGHADASSRWRRTTWHGGLELMASGQLPIRAGWTWRPARSAGDHELSLGIGWVNPSGALDLAYRQPVDGSDGRTVVVGLRSFL